MLLPQERWWIHDILNKGGYCTLCDKRVTCEYYHVTTHVLRDCHQEEMAAIDDRASTARRPAYDSAF